MGAEWLHQIQSFTPASFDALAIVLRNKMTWIPLYILIGIYLFMRHEKNVAIAFLVFSALSAGLGDIVSSHILKPYFAHLRPCQEPLLGFKLLIDHCPKSYSFPSSHATNHMALAVFWIGSGYFSKTQALFFLIWVFIIIWAQMVVGVHYPKDIVAGLILGSLIGYMFTRVFLHFVERFSLQT
ncbi:MAG: phosphatase PAP2 family protein [Saprospirales bacterium]|nr:phosphatase PAP2 family protein [Saprospirales bacterium]|tara:strand:+ start:2597 stop:3145 length:549 start_codon:yes stop_codon:yes gene_type:complete